MLGVQLERQLLAYTTTTAMPDRSHIYELHCKSEPCWILSPLREAKDWTCILMHISWVHYCWATSETEISFIIFLIRCFIYILWFSSSKEIRTNHLSSEGSTGGGGGAVLASVPTRSFKAALEKWDPSPKKGPCFLAERDEEQKSSLGTKGFVKKNAEEQDSPLLFCKKDANLP